MDGSGNGKATLNDVWHRIGQMESKIEARLDHFGERIAPIETFAKGYSADRNRILGAVAAIAAVAAFIVTGIKTWVMSLVTPS